MLLGACVIASLVASSWACAEAWGWSAAAGVVAGAVAVGGVAWALAGRLGGDEGAMLLGVGALAYAAAVGLIAVAAVVAADARREAGRDDGE